MKNFILKRPILFSIILSLVIFLGGSVAGIILGLVVMGRAMAGQNCDPGDVCDGGAMVAGAIWTLSFWASAVLAIIAGISTYVVIKLKTRIH